MLSVNSFIRAGFARRMALLVVAFALAGVTAWASGVDPLVANVQSILADLQTRLKIPGSVHVQIVKHDQALVSVRRSATDPDAFDLHLESGFVQGLNDEELRAVVAHELGHVWIFTHWPYLQTERLANRIACRAVDRSTLLDVYGRVNAYRQERNLGTLPLATRLGAGVP